MPNEIIISGAREHNLKNISLRLPRDKMIVITGLSGSGKSSLAFDTIYAEGQRRYVESLSAYARQFLGQMQKPDIDSIEGLSPAISIDQRAISKNPRSTVGTVTEIYDYLRLLYARIGKPHCPHCGKLIAAQSQQQIVDQILGLSPDTRFMVEAPLIRGRKGEYRDLLEQFRRDGFTRARIDGEIRELEEAVQLDKNTRHDIAIIVDRLVIKQDLRHRLADSVETAAALSGGLVNIVTADGETATYSEQFACPDCGVSLAELAPRIFSFNSPYGACENCTGLGF
ncbi:MAG: excinuclease ABC subunit UvrA, partial [Thermoleophilia bacterium]|nr:excinuclease ABC subunit UvrA [Thermoleophilia bacterium]